MTNKKKEETLLRLKQKYLAHLSHEQLAEILALITLNEMGKK